jgi:hypothetical protein
LTLGQSYYAPDPFASGCLLMPCTYTAVHNPKIKILLGTLVCTYFLVQEIVLYFYVGLQFCWTIWLHSGKRFPLVVLAQRDGVLNKIVAK